LSLTNFTFFNIKKKVSKHCKPKIIRFVNYNKYKYIENWYKEQVLLYSSFQNLKNSQLGPNVTRHDGYCQQHDEFFLIKSIFTIKCHIQIVKNTKTIRTKLKRKV
jgi:translation initiation factor IF-3